MSKMSQLHAESAPQRAEDAEREAARLREALAAVASGESGAVGCTLADLAWWEQQCREADSRGD